MLPDRLTTVDLDEPSPLVIRFRDLDELPEKMAVLLRRSPGWAAAADWRKKTSWESIAAETADIYRKVLK
jgi:hypothetical protein